MMMKFDKFLEGFVDVVFSTATLFLILFSVVIYVMFSVAEAQEVARKNTQKITEACYSQGMVVVRTDVGSRCADPRTLVKVK
jgi:ascorbate-specific PTS system EIIC-type component UlaA